MSEAEAKRNFFRAKLNEYGITEPTIKQLGSRKAVESFFASVSSDWKMSKMRDYDNQPEFDVDHFLININSSEYDYLVDQYDEEDNTSESSTASLEAKKLGLIKKGYGCYVTAKDPEKIAYITVHGKLCKAHIANKIKKVAQAVKQISNQHKDIVGKNSNKTVRLENKAKKLLASLEKHDPVHTKKIKWDTLKDGNRRMYYAIGGSGGDAKQV